MDKQWANGNRRLFNGHYTGFIQLGNNFKSGSGDYLTLLFNEGNAKQKTNGHNNHKVKIPLKKVTKYVTEKGKKHEKSEKKLKPLIVNARKKKSTRHRRGTNKNRKKTKKRRSSYTTTRTKKGRRIVRRKGRKGRKIGSPRSTTKKRKIRKQIQEYKYATSYMNSDAYSDFWGDFILERQKVTNNGKTADKWVAEIIQYNSSTGEPYSVNTDGVTHLRKEKLDTSSKFGFALANVGVFFGKHDIDEDLSKPPVVYRTDFETLTDYKEWRTDGSTDADDNPHIIAKAGDEIVIDTTDNNVTINGQMPINMFHGCLLSGIPGGLVKNFTYPDPANADDTRLCSSN